MAYARNVDRVTVTQSGRTSRPPEKFADMSQRDFKAMLLQAEVAKLRREISTMEEEISSWQPKHTSTPAAVPLGPSHIGTVQNSLDNTYSDGHSHTTTLPPSLAYTNIAQRAHSDQMIYHAQANGAQTGHSNQMIYHAQAIGAPTGHSDQMIYNSQANGAQAGHSNQTMHIPQVIGAQAGHSNQTMHIPQVIGAQAGHHNQTMHIPQVIGAQMGQNVHVNGAPASHTHNSVQLDRSPVTGIDTSTADALNHLADLLTQKQERLPYMEPDVFTGDLMKFPEWIRSFEALIEHYTNSPQERLHYLSKYTAGEAKTTIQWLLSINSYDEAKQALIRRYGDKYKISEEFRRKIISWPNIKPGDGDGLQKFADFLNHCNTAMTSISYLKSLDSAEENKRLMRKLPSYISHRWCRIIDKWLYGDYNQRSAYGDGFEGSYPPFSEFCRFITDEARIASGPGNFQPPLSDKRDDKRPTRNMWNNRQTKKAGSFVSQGSDSSTMSTPAARSSDRANPHCLVCKDSHYIGKCSQFKRMSTNDRKSLARSNGLCYGCFSRGHLYSDCRRKNPKLMYGDQPTSDKPSGDQRTGNQPTVDQPTSRENTTTSVTSHKIDSTNVDTVTGEECLHSMIVPVVIHHVDNPENKICTYALLDNQSNACFLTDSLLEEINAPSQAVNLKLTTVLAEKVVDSSIVQGLVVQGADESQEVLLPGSYTRSSISLDKTLVPRPETVRRWPHLQEVSQKLYPYQENIDIGLLIGFNCSVALLPREVITAGDNDPYAIRTTLGWGVTGVVTKKHKCNNVVHHDCASNHVHVNHECFNPFSFITHVKEFEPVQVKEMFQLDFNEMHNAEPMSIQDQRFLKAMKEGIHRRRDGHFEMPLPFKIDNVQLPNNRTIAMKRLSGLQRKLNNDSKYKEHYVTSMTDLVTKGYAETVTPDDLMNDQKKIGKIWYIPHHGVYHAHKPGKIRVVFDCSAEFKGQSLNQHLLSGPDLINNLTGVLCRFRREKVAFTCDIEGMFHQVCVDEADRDFLRFLWWENGDTSNEPHEYRMTVHLFGATSSPGCANLALKTIADIYEAEYGSSAAEFVRNNFYVDDGLASVADVDGAIQLYKSTATMCAQGGFRLHKVSSNSKEVIQSVDVVDRANLTKDSEIHVQNLCGPLVSAIGIRWCLESDTFLFRIDIQDKPLTRRGVLSTVSSIFDPLGLIAPFLLLGKKLLQELCRGNIKWDDPVPDEIRTRWERWRLDLLKLSQLQVPRCYKPTDFGTPKTMELHHFSDASMEGYGECTYLRQIDDKNRVVTSLVMAKSRVTPTKTITIPRLELTAAVVSVKVSNFLRKELHYEHVTEIFWTDSQVVLGYIANESRRFHIFVANRVQQIRDSTRVEQWNYVDTKSNPADKASRGMSADEMLNSELWWKGPEFLSSTLPLPLKTQTTSLSSDDPEVKNIVVHAINTQLNQPPDLLTRLQYFSSWHRAKRAIAVCIKYRDILRDRVRGDVRQNHKYVPVNVQELQDAERVIIKAAQIQAFSKEYKTLVESGPYAEERQQARKRNTSLKRDSCLYRLDPYIGNDGLIRVGGRVKRANVPRELAHPVILPRHNHVTKLVISYHHIRTCHSGRGTTLNELRASGYWIIQARAAVAAHLWGCVTCRKLRSPTVGQKMADLPENRLEPAPPFSNSGVDYFGPFYVKEGRSEKKRWGALFTCLVTRAIHIEVAHSLSTDSFLNAYRRFVGRRGRIRQLRSDRGTNFVGAKGELEAALNEMHHDKIQQELLKDGCDWIQFQINVPHASHMGGVWERMIRSARTVLSALLDQHSSQLDDELLHTLMIEAEAIVNSRPLTYTDMTSPDSAEPLTPSQILTLKSKVVLPLPGHFVKEDLYCRKRWRRVQFLANEFWTRWRKEYIPTLQERHKWTKPQENLKLGDIVLMLDENVPRCEWPKAIVVDTYPSEDTYVRKVKVKTATSSYERPVHKLVLLYRPSETG